MPTSPHSLLAATAEYQRLDESARREQNWKRWGPYLSERQWGTVREDYSADGNVWHYFPHDHARSRAYRWGEDGLLGITDRECRLCFALALWNGRDPILKERLFGLAGPEGNHGEDVKECYFYLDSSPTHAYMKALYKYPQAEFPYTWLVEENRNRGRGMTEFELRDTGVFDDGRYFDVVAEYAKASANDVLARITVTNRGPEAAEIHVLPTLWFRNTWVWGCKHEGCTMRPTMRRVGPLAVQTRHESLGEFRCEWEVPAAAGDAPLLFTDNHTNNQRLYGAESVTKYVRDAFHDYVIGGREEAVNPREWGTKVAPHIRLAIAAGKSAVVRVRLTSSSALAARNKAAVEVAGAQAAPPPAFGPPFDAVFTERLRETDEFYDSLLPRDLPAETRRVARQSYAGLLWTKQFYHYVLKDWVEGDPDQIQPPDSRLGGRNVEWTHLYARDVISMPDKWEYPWFAAWDLAFHMVPFARIDPKFSKDQLLLFLREWYMHPNGQIPAYEFAFGDVNPPVHAWAAWRVYKMTGPRGQRDTLFLERVFQKLLMNFTWWVNRKDPRGKNIFGGGFLGLDNIGVFDRSQPLPTGGHLEQADGTAWMAFYCATMLAIALELAQTNPAYEDIASKFFEHFVAITDAINTLGGTGLWDEEDGFYYDQIHIEGRSLPLKVRSLVGVIPLFAVEALAACQLEKLPGFRKRMDWFLEHRADLARHISFMEPCAGGSENKLLLLAIPTRDRLVRMLHYVLNEEEFLSPHGVRSLSRVHRDKPFTLWAEGREYRVEYAPGDSTTGIFGGNSNWRGPIWFPLNFLLIEALERYHHFYGDTLLVECPVGSGDMMNLSEVAKELSRRLLSLFLPDGNGNRPCHGGDALYGGEGAWRDLVLFYEYFHGDTGSGIGASHQTGWTALVTSLIDILHPSRRAGPQYSMMEMAAIRD